MSSAYLYDVHFPPPLPNAPVRPCVSDSVIKFLTVLRRRSGRGELRPTDPLPCPTSRRLHFGGLSGHFRRFGDQKYSRHVGDFSKHTEPIPTTRGSLESLFGSASNDTTMVGNGSGYFEIQVGEVDFAQPKIWPFESTSRYRLGKLNLVIPKKS